MPEPDEESRPQPLEDEPYDASDQEQVNEAKRAAGRRRKEDQGIVRMILATAPGRRWLREKLVRTHMYSTSFSDDPYRTAFQEGERNIGLMLVAEAVAADAEKYVLMMKEGGGG